MNWKEETVSKLKRYEQMEAACKNIPLELQRLKAEFYRLKGKPDTVAVCKTAGRCEDRLLDNLVLRKELEDALANSIQWLEVMTRALELLQQQERKILERLYIYPEKNAVERLCKELGMERSTLYRHRDRALLKLTRSLYGGAADEKE